MSSSSLKILVVGSGGREHALVRAVATSPLVENVYCWPGNGGILKQAVAVPVPNGELTELVSWAKKTNIDLVVIGPENELVAGLSNLLRAAGIKVFGPSQEAAQLEGSKIFAKNFMNEFLIPTARSEVVSSVKEALHAAQKFTPPYVLKADGLAAGKGVFICSDLDELRSAAQDLFENRKLGEAGRTALLEENLPGEELSVLVLTNGKDYQILPYTRDHKRLKEGQTGPNTGGMGVVGPIQVEERLAKLIENQIVAPSIAGINKKDFLYRGVLFIGVMVVNGEPKVLEYNVRFGDPETQVLMPLLDGDWAAVFCKIAEGNVPDLNWLVQHVVCVVVAAKGYPEIPVKGVPIEGDVVSENKHQYVLHAGTIEKEGAFYVNGGRVLNCVGIGETLDRALAQAYHRLSQINWPGMQYRRDIGR